MLDKETREEIDIINFFFSSTNDKGIIPFSSLYLLQKHVEICFGLNNSTFPKAIWPGAIALLCGIDMLSIYFSNSDKSSSGVFTDFCNICMKTSDEESNAIFMLRNALVHCYSLRAFDDVTKRFFKFFVDFKEDEDWFVIFVTDSGDDIEYRINLYNLYTKFELSVKNYYEKLSDPKNKSLRDNFKNARKRFGTIGPKTNNESYPYNFASASGLFFD